jgi:hypothetical protein
MHILSQRLTQRTHSCASLQPPCSWPLVSPATGGACLTPASCSTSHWGLLRSVLGCLPGAITHIYSQSVPCQQLQCNPLPR